MLWIIDGPNSHSHHTSGMLEHQKADFDAVVVFVQMQNSLFSASVYIYILRSLGGVCFNLSDCCQ